MEQRAEIVNKLSQFFADEAQVHLAWLFGSVASGRAMRESDIDIAVWLAPGYTYADIVRLQGDLEKFLQRSTDLVVLNDSNPLVALEAINGIPLYARSEREQLETMLDISRMADDWHTFIDSLLTERRQVRQAKTLLPKAATTKARSQ